MDPLIYIMFYFSTKCENIQEVNDIKGKSHFVKIPRTIFTKWDFPLSLCPLQALKLFNFAADAHDGHEGKNVNGEADCSADERTSNAFSVKEADDAADHGNN